MKTTKKQNLREARQSYQKTTKAYKGETFPYSRILFRKFYDRIRLRLIKDAVGNRAGTILDVGCCDGYVLLTTPQSSDMKIGIDVMLEPLKDAKRAAKVLKKPNGTEFLLNDAEKLVLRNDSVDVITSGELLEHVFNPFEVLQEYSRVLRTGGLLILSVPNVHFIISLISNIFRRKVHYRSPFHLREYSFIKTRGATSLRELYRELDSLNFKIIAHKNIGVFYLPFQKLAKFSLFSTFLENFELELSEIIPPILGGAFMFIEAEKVSRSLNSAPDRTQK